MYRFFLPVLLGALCLPMPGEGAPYPNSGLIYQDMRNERLQTPRREPAPMDLETPVDAVPADSGSLDVSHFVVFGNSVLSERELGDVLEPYSHRTISSAQLNEAANSLRARYRQLGLFLAQVYIPPQSIDDGIVTLHVYEGRLEQGGVELDMGASSHVAGAALEAVLADNLVSGTPLHRAEVERAILLADDLPGVTSHSLIYPGSEVGEGRFRMHVEDTPRITGNIDADNFGNYYTGRSRLGTTLYINSPTRRGDQLTFRLVTSGSDSNYGFVDYSLPVTGSGMRVGVSADYLDYALGEEFSQFDADGEVSSLRAFASYPFRRSRHVNMTGTVEYSYLSLEDSGLDGELLSERRISLLSAGVRGDSDGDRWVNGTTYYSAGVAAGKLDIRGGDAFAEFDAAFVGTEGSFVRLNAEVSRLQHLFGNWSANASIAGQWASGNLDPSQKFYLGGPFSVPGYPIGEASGDHGALVHADVRYDLPRLAWGGATQLSLFYGAGWVQLFDETWQGWEGNNPMLENQITLQSWGATATQTWDSGLILRASIGRQVGDNIGRDPLTGEATDRSTDSYRAWAQFIYYF